MRHRAKYAILQMLIGAVAATGVLLADLQPTRAARLYEIPIPRGSRKVAPDLYASSLPFRKAVRYYRKIIKAKGWLHVAVPVYRYRGTVVARFISSQVGTKWSAIQVFKHRGRTHIAVIPAEPLTPRPPQGKSTAP